MGKVASELLAKGLAQAEEGHTLSAEWRTWNLGKARIDLEDKEAMRVALDGQA